MAQLGSFRVSDAKRTRVLSAKQSRGGCNTCKTRRVKCDETKPICQRCVRVDRICEYGPKRADSTSSTISIVSTSLSNPALSSPLSLGPTYEDLPMYSISPACALSDSIWQNPEQSRLANLGCWVLGNDPMIDTISIPDSSVWLKLLPQLVHSTRTAYASAAAFGAVYESCIMSQDGGNLEAQASLLYSNALSVLQETLSDMSAGTAPLLLSCILLACVEVVQRRRTNALRHLEGAFKLLEIADDSSLCLTPATPGTPSSENSLTSSASSSSLLFIKRDDLFLLLKGLDVQTSTYSLGKPHLPAAPSEEIHFEFTSVRGADFQLIIILHNVHHFTSQVARMKYLDPSHTPRERSVEQGRHLAQLTLWLAQLDTVVLHHAHTLAPAAHQHALMLRAQCLIATVVLSMVLCPYEARYDRHAAAFEQIVAASEVVVAAKAQSRIKFRPGLGIIQPLLLVALKYRHAAWRRRALALLQRTGIEGPWHGTVEAALARRVIEIEEETLPEPHEDITPDMIPERKRIHGQHLLQDTSEWKRDKVEMRMSFSRCVDVEYMISGAEYKTTGKQVFEHAKHWNIWEENIDLDTREQAATTSSCPVDHVVLSAH